MNYNKWLDKREHGLLSDNLFIHNRIYNSIEPYVTWSGNEEGVKSAIGSVFNLEFSPEGKTLVAACERHSVVLFDAFNGKELQRITDAHSDNVNCIKFVSPHTFATGSDDYTVALWDLRNLKKKVRSLHGHMNWVKNIEYSNKNKLLVTSGFDGSVFSWDLQSYTEQGLTSEKVFHTSGLMRCRISPDGDKLVLCTTGGYMLIVHDLDLLNLSTDLNGFRPSIYRLMQMGQQYIPQAAKYDHVFSKNRKRNRVELVSDFPEGNDAEVIIALQIHPQGNSFLSRNVSFDEDTQWSCVHDINEAPYDTSSPIPGTSKGRKRKLNAPSYEEFESELNVPAPIVRRGSRSSSIPTIHVDIPNEYYRNDQFVPDIWAAEVTLMERATRVQRGARQTANNTVQGYNYVYAISSGVLQAQSRRMPNTNANANAANVATDRNLSGNSSTNGRAQLSESAVLPEQRPERRIYQNAKKLMFQIQESMGAGSYIKEPGYSADGRIICSPYDTGVRLLAYNNTCSEYPNYSIGSRDKSTPLTVIQHYVSHENSVLVAKFNPVAPLLVSGCLNGKIVWYRPVL